MTEARTLKDNRLEYWCICLGAHTLFGLFFVGWFLLCRFVPAPSPSASAEEVARRFADNRAGIQVGATVELISVSLWAFWGGVVAAWTRRALGGGQTLAYMQIVCIAVAEMVGILNASFWAIAAFRPGQIDPQITATLNDIAFMFFLITWPPFSVWCITVAIAVFRDKRIDNEGRSFPRWVGYLSLLTAFLFAPAGLPLFFKHTGYGYDGLLGMWIPFGIFFVWVEGLTFPIASRLQAEARALRAALPDASDQPRVKESASV